MDESGQTNEERRELRLKQRTLKNKIIEQQAVSARVCLSVCIF